MICFLGFVHWLEGEHLTEYYPQERPSNRQTRAYHPTVKRRFRCKDLEHKNLQQAKSLNLEKIMNEKMSKRRIQITDLQKQEIEEKQEIRLLIRLHIFYLILLINL